MAYGSVNVPGANTALAELRKLAQNAKDTADKAIAAVNKYTGTVNTDPIQNGSLVYTGAALSPSWDNYDSAQVEISGTTSATSAGTYNTTFTPKTGYTWPDGTSDAKTITWTIERAVIAIPSQIGSLTYAGAVQTPTWSGYDSSKMTIGGKTSGTNAGGYSATFTPKSNYQFSDGTTGTKTVVWTIGKATGAMTVSKSTIALSLTTKQTAITVTRPGDGTITAVSSDTSIAAVSVDGTIVTVTAGSKTGAATITIKCAAGTNYKAPADVTIKATVSTPSSSLADNTPAEIQAAAQSGQAANLWSVGDKFPITIEGTVGAIEIAGTYYAFIIGFDHNSDIEGGNSIHFQVGKDADGTDIAFVDGGYGYGNAWDLFHINKQSTNTGGWAGSYMRTLCTAFYNALPTEWQDVIAPCIKYTDNVGGGNGDVASYVSATQDKVWLLGAFEIFAKSLANAGEADHQKQYDFYRNGGSKVKHMHNKVETPCSWWTRSAYKNNNYSYVFVTESGGSGSISATYSLGFAPAFKVA